MVDRNSLRYDVLKLEKLIRSYVNSEGNSSAKIELSNMIIDGEELTDVLDNLELETEKEIEENRKLKVFYEEKCDEYIKLEENHKKLEENYKELEKEYHKNITEDIEKLIQGKKGPFIDKIRDILDE